MSRLTEGKVGEYLLLLGNMEMKSKQAWSFVSFFLSKNIFYFGGFEEGEGMIRKKEIAH